MFSRKALFFICIALLSPGLANVATTASAAPTAPQPWGPVTKIPNAHGSSLAVDAQGTTTVVWATSSYPHKIKTMRRPVGRHWGDPVVIGSGVYPEAATDARGRVTVAWITQREGFADGVAAARRSTAGTWSDPVPLSTDRRVAPDPNNDEAEASQIDLSVGSSGAAVVAWQWGSYFGEKELRIRAAYRPAGGPWGEQATLTAATGADRPQVGVDGEGAVVLAYETHEAVKVRRLVEQHWTKAVKVAAHSIRHELAVDKAGNAMLAFQTDYDGKVRAAFRPAAGPWGAPQNVSEAGVPVDEFSLAMNGPGTAVIGYTHEHGRIDVADRPAGGSWSTPAQIARSRNNSADLLVALNTSGDTFAAWGYYGLFGKYRPAAGVWSDRYPIRSDTQGLADVLEEVHVAVRPGGGAVALWDQECMPLKVRMMSAS